ncbi:transcriptional regulator, LysR family [Denitrovibrio acetiphilus DSM 12809]|uniref:Transcriptional regulator, LysR family n=1 Tax=Denitrovibrio acetiphilus (strain DSM 12809 / NBRC 114555 / N2460) TaxID=522772 RepID=D4H7B5_DENA2|nr:LysR family transcriptional regulator [Denitrovibrio acetiphilus]ADD67914.1 transcriptional regulator, LysR family [Denitrovibrio acetiphilus DSM 12809]
MDSSLLRVFLAVAQEGSFSGAAKKLNYVQSNVTARIKQLEEAAGHQLFYRKPRGVVLTPAGGTLIANAKEIVRRLDDAAMMMRNFGEKTGSLRIGSTESNAALRLTPALVQLHKKYPRIELQLMTGTTKAVIEELLNYNIDIAFVSGIPENSDLEVLEVYDEEMVMVEPAEGDIPDVIITFKKGCTYKEALENLMPELGYSSFRVMEFGSLETIIGCVSAGMGRTLLPLKVVESIADLKRLSLISLPDGCKKIPTCMVCRKDARPVIDLRGFGLTVV